MARERRGRAARALALAVLAGAAAPLVTAQPAAPPQLAACVACHGPGGSSQIPTMPSLAGQPRVFLENQMVLIREGLREIPAMKGLLDGVDDAAITAMARHFAEQPAPAPRAPTDMAAFERGKTVSAKMLCGTCHRPDYSGQQQVPRLAGQQEVFLRDSMKQLRDAPGPGRDTIMAASLRGLSDKDLSDIAHYLANFR